MAESEPTPTITIKRDSLLHSWVYADSGAHPVKLPWSDDAPADMVVRYIKTLANGAIKVQVDLS